MRPGDEWPNRSSPWFPWSGSHGPTDALWAYEYLDCTFRHRRCGYSAPAELDGGPSCGADWKAIDVSHGPACPKNRLDEAMDTPNGALVRRCFRILNARCIGLTITLADITEEEFPGAGVDRM